MRRLHRYQSTRYMKYEIPIWQYLTKFEISNISRRGIKQAIQDGLPMIIDISIQTINILIDQKNYSSLVSLVFSDNGGFGQ